MIIAEQVPFLGEKLKMILEVVLYLHLKCISLLPSESLNCNDLVHATYQAYVMSVRYLTFYVIQSLLFCKLPALY